MNLAKGFALGLCLVLLACGGSTPDGSCLTDYDCEFNQVCGLEGFCLECDNCQRGWVGTCTAPVWPLERQPTSIWIEDSIDGDVLVYGYECDGNMSEYRYVRPEGEACFSPEFGVRDPCGFDDDY